MLLYLETSIPPVIGRSSRPKISKVIVNLNSTISQLDLTEICTIYYLTTAECKLLPTIQRIFTKIELILAITP